MAAYTAGICSLGCKVNFYESEYFAEAFTKLGVTVQPFDTLCDIYVINSCTVTGESDRKVLQMVRRAATRNPGALILVTGCLAQMNPERIAAVPGVDAIIGNTQKKEVVRYVRDYIEGKIGKHSVPALEVAPFPEKPEFESMQLTATHHARATVKIEDGCNSACAYCIISQARGPARSKEPQAVLSEIRALAALGYREVILTGIELASYDGDLPHLVREIGKIEGIERIRLGSLDPAYLTPARIAAFADAEKLMPHFHISLQSGSTAVLNAMRRKYNADMARRNLTFLRSRFPDAQFFADIIVGFPGETEEQFEETIRFIQEISFLHLHIFPYSKRSGTIAASLPNQIPQEIKKERATRLAEIQASIKRSILEDAVKKAAPFPVLFETEAGGVAYGHSHHFIEVGVPGLADSRGKILSVLPLSTDGERLTGRVLS